MSKTSPLPDAASLPDLGIYAHVPFCKHACPYCDFFKIELRDRPARDRLEFPALLAREHALLLQAHPDLARRPLATLYFGGGTPSTLRPSDLQACIQTILARHPRHPDPEVTLEANPENLTPSRCQQWRAAGITRLSIGVQSFHDEDLRRLERLHAPQTIRTAFHNARATGFRNISGDLMFALPGQTLTKWQANLRSLVELEPDHISFYGLTLHEGTPFHEEAAAGSLVLPVEDKQAEMYLWGSEFLRSAGYEHYEVSNLARTAPSGKPCRSRHNQRYWTRADVLPLGPGAHGNLGELRWRNPDDLGTWQEAVQGGRLARTEPEPLVREVQLEEALFCRLRRCEGFELSSEEAVDRAFARWLASPTGRRAEAEGLVERAGQIGARLTVRGWLVAEAVERSVLPFCTTGVPPVIPD